MKIVINILEQEMYKTKSEFSYNEQKFSDKVISYKIKVSHNDKKFEQRKKNLSKKTKTRAKNKIKRNSDLLKCVIFITKQATI